MSFLKKENYEKQLVKFPVYVILSLIGCVCKMQF